MRVFFIENLNLNDYFKTSAKAVVATTFFEDYAGPSIVGCIIWDKFVRKNHVMLEILLDFTREILTFISIIFPTA